MDGGGSGENPLLVSTAHKKKVSALWPRFRRASRVSRLLLEPQRGGQPGARRAEDRRRGPTRRLDEIGGQLVAGTRGNQEAPHGPEEHDQGLRVRQGKLPGWRGQASSCARRRRVEARHVLEVRQREAGLLGHLGHPPTGGCPKCPSSAPMPWLDKLGHAWTFAECPSSKYS